MNTTRRDTIKSILAATAVSAVPAVAMADAPKSYDARTTGAGSANARWTFSMGETGPVITNAQYPNRTLQYNETSKLFRCYAAGTQAPLTLFLGGKGENWYTTELRDKVACQEHSFGDWTVTAEPTCTETGKRCRICTVCGYRETEVLDALGHAFGDWTVTVAPTCTEAGAESRTCSRCSETETRELAALGHQPGDPVKEQEGEPNQNPACK